MRSRPVRLMPASHHRGNVALWHLGYQASRNGHRRMVCVSNDDDRFIHINNTVPRCLLSAADRMICVATKM
jgi:hypothetical protein